MKANITLYQLEESAKKLETISDEVLIKHSQKLDEWQIDDWSPNDCMKIHLVKQGWNQCEIGTTASDYGYSQKVANIKVFANKVL